jgi:thiamine-monophosphate kinase
MLHRAGGRPGDDLFVSGTIGASRIGLALLRGEEGAWLRQLGEQDRHALIGRYRVPEPRPELAPALVEFATAAMDVSDGLVGDCDKLCTASGCSAVLSAETIPLPPQLARPVENSLLTTLITAGDDYEILAAVPAERRTDFCLAAERAGVQVSRIGALVEGRERVGVLFEGAWLSLSERAFAHGRVEEVND